uniref:Uncharacterized protein n=1 Tax=Palpitomonas bilix TaxID=652834 RepID=A0A7S3GGN9_9EUKA|mmetsp:Transcript_48588/g.126073  ORF Transcript_48588/g.126073 Transcript_48588/m.126073 type:complete len:116 (+) Transcript_48588:405-752(+)
MQLPPAEGKIPVPHSARPRKRQDLDKPQDLKFRYRPRPFRIDPRRSKTYANLDEKREEEEEERTYLKEKEAIAVDAFRRFRRSIQPKRTAGTFRFANSGVDASLLGWASEREGGR